MSATLRATVQQGVSWGVAVVAPPLRGATVQQHDAVALSGTAKQAINRLLSGEFSGE